VAFDGISGLEVARARYSDSKESHLPFQMNDPDHYRLPTKVLTALGGRTPGHFGRQKKGRGGQSAEMRIYTVQE
jgi:hypothetical protein